MRRAAGRGGSILASLAIITVGFISLRARPGPAPAALAPVAGAGGSGSVLRAMPNQFALAGPPASAQLLPQAPSKAVRARLARGYGRLPLTFIANRGQLDRRVAYYVAGRDKTLY